jgi:hypothetical protein
LRARFAGLSVDFGAVGLYYDARKGANYWLYYWQPIRRGRVDTRLKATTVATLFAATDGRYEMASVCFVFALT